uniref:INTS5_N domain-containing protein n=1 Tax=Angiostrongylus cantonensis TaxID=6313 RepID=A0A0K0CUX6_ANGCA
MHSTSLSIVWRWLNAYLAFTMTFGVLSMYRSSIVSSIRQARCQFSDSRRTKGLVRPASSTTALRTPLSLIRRKVLNSYFLHNQNFGWDNHIDIHERRSSELGIFHIFQWCCSISSELSQHNAGRLSVINLPRSPESLLELFKMVGSIAHLIKLIDITITILLANCPDECMTVLFDASRHGTNFNWIWLHIAITFPGSIVDHLLTVGADQFKAYVEDIKLKEKHQVSPAIIASIHDDYNVKFSSLSDVFNFLTRRNNTELERVVSRMIKAGVQPLFSTVTATPANFFRGIRQLLSVDQRLVLSTISYMEFAKQMIRALDTHSLSVVFSCVMQMALDPLIFSRKCSFHDRTVLYTIKDL